MQEINPLSQPQMELEAALKSLKPKSISIDPMELAYCAGRTVGRRSVWLWRAACIIMALIAAGACLKPANPPASVVVASKAPVMTPDVSNLRAEMQVINRGWNALPPVRGPGARPIHAADLF
ncbi:MAG TPA: hypothetical protein VMD30_06745 [Tepidisphaeraceae bacterium]|nr:hypothetical protein [Tepidisphaeraceae bacterium]